MPWVLIGPVAGLAWGAVDSVVNHVPEFLGEIATPRAERSGWAQASEFASLILDAGWAWAALAVLSGWLVCRSPGSGSDIARGAVAGWLALVFATSAYYFFDSIFDNDTWWGIATRYWLIGSSLFGPPLGAVGALIRRPGRVGMLAGMVVPVGAALQMLVRPPASNSLMAVPVRSTVLLGAAIAAAMVVRRYATWRRASTSVGAESRVDRPSG
ncbi:hypothetical protein Ari01nite_69700 [Paractinoplanes rishiriensis]|uniref:Uncharacterized protein n=1 Tax=Paractinoplanes rishiriensis TaxID=1050105 RepID=A0A919K5X2_9ACTN|nr:hypothetical protein Ari01nite_69700 [Actinoplanes rishiriensis]